MIQLLKYSLFLVIPFWLGMSIEVSAQDQIIQTPIWPKAYTATFGFEIMEDHTGGIIVSLVDSTTQAYQLGVRPGMELIGWNTLPVKKKLDSMKVRRYRKSFPMLTDERIKLLLLPRGRPGEKAEVFFMTPTGNNRGISLTASAPNPWPLPSAR